MEILINGLDPFHKEISAQDIQNAWNYLKEAYKQKQKEAKTLFEVGDKVSFMSKKRPAPIEGFIFKIDKKFIKVIPTYNPNAMWRVTPTMLTLIEKNHYL